MSGYKHEVSTLWYRSLFDPYYRHCMFLVVASEVGVKGGGDLRQTGLSGGGISENRWIQGIPKIHQYPD